MEKVIDLVAGKAAFHTPYLLPVVNHHANRMLTWDTVDVIRSAFAPSASREAMAKAVVDHWPVPAFYLIGDLRTRKNEPHESSRLRVSIHGFNKPASSSGIRFFRNMRVPESSVAFAAFLDRVSYTERELLSVWQTSGGSRLPDVSAVVSACPTNIDAVHILVSLE